MDRGELALVAVERTRMPMVVTDPRQPGNPIVWANQAFLTLSGYEASEVIGRNCKFLQGPDTAPEDIDSIRAALARQQDCTVEILNYRKDGTPFWNLLYFSPVRDEAGELLYFFGSQKDVTRRREAEKLEAAERALLKEIDHRAKNALALVQAIVRLSPAKDAAAYKAAVQGRVVALARAHELLAANRWQGVPLEVLIDSQLLGYGSGRVAAGGPPVEVSAQVVQPLSLFLHEMIINASNHGALSAPEGRLSLTWRLEEPQGQIVLDWLENGGPSPAADRKPGFGSFIVNAVLQRQLQGGVEMDWRPEGLRAQVRFRTHPFTPVPT